MADDEKDKRLQEQLQDATIDSSNLPVRRHEADIISAVSSSPVTIVTGETGSGKTTQLPQMLLDAPALLGESNLLVAVTQPRRVAAISVARRVSAERKCRIGGEVGYAVRFEEQRSRDTRLIYLTDGTLLREVLTDPLLARYGVVVLDEAHERSLNTDILFALLKRLVATRAQSSSSQRLPPLKVVVMSATMDTHAIAGFFGAESAAVLDVPGRQYPVSEVWSQEAHEREYVAAAAEVAVQIHSCKPPGDILVFLAGQAEVEKAVRLIHQQVQELEEGTQCGELIVFGLYAAMPMAMQARVFQKVPEGTRRCIVATNIAETSLTIDGIAYVVDSGVCKEKTYDSASGIERLQVQPISRVQAIQRGGRAGRTGPGECWRLYTKAFYDRKMVDVSPPEIQRVPLAGAVLALKSLPAALGIDVLAFEFVDSPPRVALEEALRQLHLLDAIDADGAITAVGRTMVHMPLEPQLARAVLASLESGCVTHMLTVAAMLTIDTLFNSEKPPKDRSELDQTRITHKQELLAELYSDGVGDHAFLLRLAELALEGSPRSHPHSNNGGAADVARTLNLNTRGLGFARKVRAQLVTVVETRVWPAFLRERNSNTAHACARDARDASDRCEGHMHGGDAQEAKRNSSKHRGDAYEDNGRDRNGGGGRERGGAERHDEVIRSGSGRQERSRDGGSRRGGDRNVREASGRCGEDVQARGGEAACPDLRFRSKPATGMEVRRLCEAVAKGYSAQIARRLDRANGYRTLCASEQSVASLHHDVAKMALDDDGLFPPWLIYHELMHASSKVMLRKVCAVEAEWVAPALLKLRDMQTDRLAKSGRPTEGSRRFESGDGNPDKDSSKKEKRDKERRQVASEGAADAQDKLAALKKRALERRQAGVGKKARLTSKH